MSGESAAGDGDTVDDTVDGGAVGDGIVDGAGSNLERRYRALLRLLPAWYRAGREEEMVGLFLTDRVDGLDLEHSWPGWGEAWATLVLAVRVRFGARRPAGGLARLVGMVGLLAGVVMAAQSGASLVRSVEPVPSWWVDAVAVVAFAALVSGHRSVGRTAAAVAGLAAAWPWAPALLGDVPSGWVLLFAVPAWVTAAAVLAGFHAEAPLPSRRWWLPGALGAAGGVLSVVAVELSGWTLLWAWLTAAALAVVFRPWRATPAPAGAHGT